MDLDRGYVSHVSDDGRVEYLVDHLAEVSDMSARFAQEFGAQSWGRVIGLLHDVGKFSNEFQDRILRNGPKVDHSTAGAWLLARSGKDLLAYCVAGHHGGLPDGTPGFDSRRSGFIERMSKAQRNSIPDFSAYEKEIDVDLAILENPKITATVDSARFTFSFLTRMLFSCLVDSDYLCTERFMNGFSREPLYYDAITCLNERLEAKINSFFPPKTAINAARCGVLDDCLRASRLERGVYSITAPTGSGKTYALMRFALNHAETHGMRRVICAEPYTSIIEQNADVYRDVLGFENVLEHHGNFDYSLNGDFELGDRLRFAAENWDAPVVVTTNVQLFESLLSNRASRCRKLHNIANSVIVLDEAQMIPIKYLVACVKCLAELVRNYGCTVVLCSATQPSLAPFFKKEGFGVKEVISDVDGLFSSLKRTSFDSVGALDDEVLAGMLAENNQALCIVNSRRQAKAVYDMVQSKRGPGGVYHLTTLMHSEHRRRVLAEIRACLDAGSPCIVVATSLIEAGVDLDFPIVFRAMAGIDSLVQAAGRCNREMKRPAAESRVIVFETANTYSLPREVDQHAAVTRSVLRYSDCAISKVDSVETIAAYFNRLYKIQDSSGLDSENVAQLLSAYGKSAGSLKLFDIPFETAANRMRFIDDSSYSVIIPTQGYEDEIAALEHGIVSRSGMRKLSRISVGIYRGDLDRLNDAGALKAVADDVFILVDADRYSQDTGLDSSSESGSGLFW